MRAFHIVFFMVVSCEVVEHIEILIQFLFMLKMHCGIVGGLRFTVSTSFVFNLYYETVIGIKAHLLFSN